MAVVDEIARLSVWIVVGAVVVSIVSQVALFISAIVELRRIRLRDRHQLFCSRDRRAQMQASAGSSSAASGRVQ